MNKSFRNAFIISILIHFMIITPLHGFSVFTRPAAANGPMSVDYMVLKEPAKAEVGNAALSCRPDKRSRAGLGSSSVKISPARSRIAQATESKIRGTKQYVNYYQVIRDRIGASLRTRYKNTYGSGDVYLIFTLRADGLLESVTVDEPASTDNEILLDTAIRSVRDAAPFAPFPPALKVPRMTFDLAVTFRK